MSTIHKIKEASLCLFSKNGYEGTSLADIAKEVGIKKSSIYAHFDNKADLFLSVFEEVFGEHIRHIQQMMESMRGFTVEQKLYKILYAASLYYLSNHIKITFLKRVMLFPPPFLKEQLRERFIKSELEMTKLLQTIFLEGIKKGEIRYRDIQDLISAYYCLLDGTFVQIFYYGRYRVEGRLQNVWDVFWKGINGGGSQSPGKYV